MNRLDLLDGNMMAYLDYERRLERAEKIEAMLEADIADNLKKIEELANEIRSIVKSYEHEYNLDFSEDVRESIKYAIGVW